MSLAHATLVVFISAAGVGLGFLINSRLYWLRPNFSGTSIPASVGICIPLAVLGALPFLPAPTGVRTVTWAAVIIAFGLLGVLDDLRGDRAFSGLKGHLTALWCEHRLTTGAVKLLGGGIVAIVGAAGIEGRPTAWILLDGLLIALSANVFNLLDVRPSRAVKVYLFAAALLALTTPAARTRLFPIVMVTALYAPFDFRCSAMLGDAGSNPLGASLGVTLVLTTPPPVRCFACVLFALFHLLTEHYSLTQLIASRPLLDAIDRWGTPRVRSR